MFDKTLCCGLARPLMPGVDMIVTIATIAEKSVSDHSDQMDTSLLTIPTIAIAGKGSGSIPAVASAIVTIAAIMWTQASDRERSERSSYFPRCTAVLVHFMLILISRQKRLERLNEHDSAIVQRSQRSPAFERSQRS